MPPDAPASTPDFRWLDASVFNGAGNPKQTRGITREDGISFIGLPWLSTWGSGRFSAVDRDSEYIVQTIQTRLGAEPSALRFAVSVARLVLRERPIHASGAVRRLAGTATHWGISASESRPCS